MNIGSQSSGNRTSYASLGKIKITGFNPSAMHVNLKMAKGNDENERDKIFIHFAGPLAGIAAAGLSLYALDKYGITEDFIVVKSMCFAYLIGNIVQLLPIEVFGTKSDGLRIYESYKGL